MAPKKRPLIERLMSHVRVDPDGCWVWTASKDGGGYGHIRAGGRMVGAHRVSYELHVGQIPDGLHIDHLCRNKLCVNPSHLEPVTNRENTLRGIGFCATHASMTHCVNGHPLDGENVRVDKPRDREPRRTCRECDKLRHRRYAAAKKARGA